MIFASSAVLSFGIVCGNIKNIGTGAEAGRSRRYINLDLSHPTTSDVKSRRTRADDTSTFVLSAETSFRLSEVFENRANACYLLCIVASR